MIIFYHDLLGHGSVNSMKYALLKKYRWNNCNQDIEEFVKSCEVCQKEKPAQEDRGNIALVTNKMGDLWEVDIVGPLRESEQVFKYILTMIDHYTKITEVALLYTKDMESVLAIIDRKICRKYGVPKKILTDNGKEFKNGLCQKYAREMGFEWKYGSPYNPTTTGLVERFNKTLVGKLRKITHFGKFDWARCLDKANKAYLYSFHRAIGCVPLELLEGQLITTMDKQEELEKTLPKDFFETKIHNYVEKYKKSYHRERNNDLKKDFKEGDYVWYKRISSTTDKLAPKWVQEGIIVGKWFDSYRVKLKDGRIILANKKHLKEFFLKKGRVLTVD
ncbi:Transposon Tf2-11 polyprotein [Nosema granulosis]|uniref:Transposon Tf2-11 polyprotein n=1 Tax=Nosema granulosis TaxID=83296 RepID=A0A9P6KYB2_9MICR|nr:Transposon Tf2-11 polyprotein [Nosema granulosis]